jgi:succinoglycan biosynthesis transport protein ExoP
MHDNFAQRYTESLQQLSFPFIEARVITHATTGFQTKPNSTMIMTLASASGLLLGFCAAFLIDLTEGGFRTPSQVESELRKSCLSVVPLVNEPAVTVHADKPALRQIEQGGILCGVISTPFSRFAEAFRTIKVGIDLLSLTSSTKTKTIGITSTLPNEGKSTVAANLARLIAHAGGKVILLDCDLRNPSLTRGLAPGAEIGMLDVIYGKSLLSEAVWSDYATSLLFLPMVAKVRPVHTNEILASGAMKKLIATLSEVYDYVLVDLPPLTPVVDVRSTTQIVDSYLFVVQWGDTTVEVVERALSSAPLVYEKLLGVVLNKADLKAMRNYSRDVDAGHKSKYYQRYGFED